MIMSSCVSKVTELETKLKTPLAAMLQASIQNKVTSILCVCVCIYVTTVTQLKKSIPPIHPEHVTANTIFN